MSMPTGDSPGTVQDYYDYLLAHHLRDGRGATWTVDWLSLAWMWGFALAMAVIIVLWVGQYRTTQRRAGGLYPVDRWGTYVTESARPASLFFILLTAGLTLFAASLIAGHLIWGQVF